ncbi:MAG: DUF1801 domain-containing protein [Oscillospiraceae bacterium]|nr:DUF1801 domain-containing protein [Oscillospiraceae bacterium]
MWECPKCGRQFSRNNQNHFCGAAPTTVEEYIAAQPESVRPILIELRDAIRAAIPDAEECISWSMPTWRGKRNIIHFAANKRHIGLYPGDEAVAFFRDRLDGYETSKGVVRFPIGQPIPYGLAAEIAAWCYRQDAQ